MKQLPQKINQADWDKHRQFIDLSTGAKMSYVEMGNPDGPVVILQHGLSDNNRVWSLSAPLFCQAGYHVFMTDLRGHGYSSVPEGFYTIIQYATDINAFMEAKNIAKARLVGHSLGSLTMQAFMLMFPEKCEKVVLVATGLVDNNFRQHTVQFYQQLLQYQPPEAVDAFFDQWYANAGYVPEEFLEDVKAESKRLPLQSWLNIMGGASVTDFDQFYTQMPQNIPTFILSGEQDPIFTPEVQEKVKQKFPHADSKAYPGVGHNIQYEIPEQFAQDTIAWLAR